MEYYGKQISHHERYQLSLYNFINTVSKMDYYINIIEYNLPNEKIKRNIKQLMRQQNIFFKHVFDSPILNKKEYYLAKHRDRLLYHHTQKLFRLYPILSEED